MPKERRYALYACLLLLLGVVGYFGTKLFGEWSAEQLEFNGINLPQEVLPGAGPLTIALICDVHNNMDLLEECAKEVEKSKPDLIIFGGDLAYNTERFTRTRRIIKAFRRLKAVAPTYAIYGNQDYESIPQVERIFATAGVPLLRNEALDWQTPSGNTLRIVGLGDRNEGDEDPKRCMQPQGQAEGSVLLLSHDPESRHQLQDYAWNLMLSGHTHGGQIGIPFTKKWISFRSDMPGGYYEENGRHHVVSRGVGAIYRMRFFCPPEVVYVKIGAK